MKGIFTKRIKKRTLQNEIDDIIKLMEEEDVSSEDYEVLLRHLERLNQLKAQQSQKGISPDTILIVAGNLIGICLILHYEQLNVVASKALGFVIRGRV